MEGEPTGCSNAAPSAILPLPLTSRITRQAHDEKSHPPVCRTGRRADLLRPCPGGRPLGQGPARPGDHAPHRRPQRPALGHPPERVRPPRRPGPRARSTGPDPLPHRHRAAQAGQGGGAVLVGLHPFRGRRGGSSSSRSTSLSRSSSGIRTCSTSRSMPRTWSGSLGLGRSPPCWAWRAGTPSRTPWVLFGLSTPWACGI